MRTRTILLAALLALTPVGVLVGGLPQRGGEGARVEVAAFGPSGAGAGEAVPTDVDLGRFGAADLMGSVDTTTTTASTTTVPEPEPVPPAPAAQVEQPGAENRPETREEPAPATAPSRGTRIVANGFVGLDGVKYSSERWGGVREIVDGEERVFARKCAKDGGTARFFAQLDDGSVRTWQVEVSSGYNGNDPGSTQYGAIVERVVFGMQLPHPTFFGGSKDGYIYCGFW